MTVPFAAYVTKRFVRLLEKAKRQSRGLFRKLVFMPLRLYIEKQVDILANDPGDCLSDGLVRELLGQYDHKGMFVS
jgi:hypothetical protein